MAERYTDWHRRRTIGPVTSSMEAHGRKVLGELMEQLRLGGLPTGVLRRQTPDGTLYIASYDGTMPTVQIIAQAQAPETPVGFAQLWIPRGFVVYPAWHDHPYGVGLPVVQQGDSPYAPQNLAPGLDVARWTPQGVCGEVLVSPDDQAGYPQPNTTPAPLLYDDVYGPRPISVSATVLQDQLPETTKWAAYRVEFVGFADLPGSGDAAFAQSVFEYINTQRKNAGVPESWLPFRGYADIAYSAALVLSQFNLPQETNPVYPPNYANSAIRMTKEGYFSDQLHLGTGNMVDRSHVFRGMEAGSIGMNAQQLFDAWQSASGDALTQLVSKSTQIFAAQVAGFQDSMFVARDRWIQTGNVYWKGTDDALPPLSWHGFMSVNLAWETWPVTINVDADGNFIQDAPLTVVTPFTDANGACWLNYARGPYQDQQIEPSLVEPALSPHIYCRGRAIASAPRNGLVWGSCVLKNGKHMDRLVALVHHPEDQPTDTTQEGFTRYFRVWWCDIPYRTNGLRLAPPLTICGEDASDAYGWKGGEQFDVGAMPDPSNPAYQASTSDKNSLKYYSAWKFKKDGSGAACLRDYASYTDYALLQNTVLSYGFVPRTVTLDFAIDKADPEIGSIGDLLTTLQFHDVLVGGNVGDRDWPTSTPLDCTSAYEDSVGNPTQFEETGAVPLAVDFDDDGNLEYFFFGDIHSAGKKLYEAGVPADGTYNQFSTYVDFTYAGTGNGDTEYISAVHHRTMVGCTFETPDADVYPARILVLDVATATFVVQETRPRFALNMAVDPQTGKDQLLLSDSYTCELFTNARVHGAGVYRGGTKIADDWYPNEDGLFVSAYNTCFEYLQETVFTFLPLAMTDCVQTYYCERFGQVVYGYQFAPVPSGAPKVSSAPASTDCGCVMKLSDIRSMPTFGYPDQNPRGGRTISTVELPDHDWCIYAKVV